MGESVSGQGHENEGTDENWIKPVGDVAAPLLAGFSFTAVIVISGDTGHRRWPSLTLLALTMAAVTLIAAVENSKYARDKSQATRRWLKWTRNLYHFGIIVFLLGLGLALAPQHGTGFQGTFQWLASAVAFVACGSAVVLSLPSVRRLFRNSS